MILSNVTLVLEEVLAVDVEVLLSEFFSSELSVPKTPESWLSDEPSKTF
jgi:hypothetical protein